MDKEKQIEEMAKAFCEVAHYDFCKNTACYACPVKLFTIKVYDKGYRKINDNEIVISKEEKQKLLKEMYEQGKFDALADLEKEGKVVIDKEEYETKKEIVADWGLLQQEIMQGKFVALADLDKDGKVVISKGEYEELIKLQQTYAEDLTNAIQSYEEREADLKINYNNHIKNLEGIIDRQSKDLNSQADRLIDLKEQLKEMEEQRDEQAYITEDLIQEKHLWTYQARKETVREFAKAIKDEISILKTIIHAEGDSYYGIENYDIDRIVIKKFDVDLGEE